MLFKIDDKGRFFEIKSVLDNKDYQKWIAKFGAGEFDQVANFLHSKVQQIPDKFSIATHFGGDWDYPLDILYKKVCKCNETQAGYLIGIMMQDVLVNDDQEWCCVKTDLTGREFMTNMYWRRAQCWWNK